jgi:hypothetical protein
VSHAKRENPHAGQGTVLLDIGGDVGALVVTMPASMVGQEVDIVPAGSHPQGPVPHVAVVERPVAGGSVPSLVFPDLVAGNYDLAPKGTRRVALTVSVRGAEVTTARWPD